MDERHTASTTIEIALDKSGTVVRQRSEPTFPGFPEKLVGRNIRDSLLLSGESALLGFLENAGNGREAAGIDLVALPGARPMLLRFHLEPDDAGTRRILLSADAVLTGFNGVLGAALGAVHEWNNAIGTIAGFADLMKDGGLPADKSRRYLERIESSIQEARMIGEKLSRDARRLAAETARSTT